MGVPQNKHNLTNASHVRYHRLKLGELPKPMISIRDRARAYRRDMERVVVEQHGEITVTHAHALDLAAKAEAMAAIAQWVLRHKLDGMSGTDIAAAAQAMVRGTQIRNAAVKELALDRQNSTEDILATLYTSGSEDASQSQEGDDDAQQPTA